MPWVVVGCNNGWEARFEGSVNGIYINWDSESLTASAIQDAESGSLDAIDKDTSRVRSGLQPAFLRLQCEVTRGGRPDRHRLHQLRAGDSDGL